MFRRPDATRDDNNDASCCRQEAQQPLCPSVSHCATNTVMGEDSPRLTFRRQRRRKRPRTTSTGNISEGNTLTDEIGKRTTASEEGKSKAPNHSRSRSIPALLYLRATGVERQGRDFELRRSSVAKRRSIRFSQLQSPNSEAVLALEQSGSYFMSLAGDIGPCALALRLYSVPSPFMLEKASVTCPLVTTVPLLFPTNDESDESTSRVATTPVQIVLSRNWSVGMAFVHHSMSTDSSRYVPEDDALGDLVLFSFSSTQGSVVHSFKCSNVRIAGSRAYTMRNLLWETNTIPYGDSTPTSLCSQVVRVPGHLFLNDEEDGFRLTWVVAAGWQHHINACVETLRPSCLSIKPSRHDIITKSDEVVWDECWSDRCTGHQMPSYRDCHTLDIAFEAYFRVDALLHDILSRRREKFGYQENALPDFHYNLISIDGVGRTAILLIVFGRTAQSGTTTRRLSVGVFLQIDLLTQSYEETGWVQNLASPTESVLRKWSNVLAVTRRMKDQKVGPYSSDLGQDKLFSTIDWTMFYNDGNNDYDQSQDEDIEAWTRYLAVLRLQKSQATSSSSRLTAPNCVSCVSLFPDCELVTNDAVRLARPVRFIRCRSLTTEFIYG